MFFDGVPAGDMETSSLFSIIVPTYNRAETILQTLDSVAAQDYRPIEIVVVDDGSTDPTHDLVRGWAARLDRSKGIYLRYKCQKNAGASTARNTGFEMSAGSLILWLDSDDLLKPNYLSTVGTVFSETGADMVICGYEFFDDVSGEILSRRSGIAGPQQLTHICHGRVHPWNSMASFRRSLVERSGLWNTELKVIEDIEFIQRALIHAESSWGVEDVLAAVRRGRSDHVTSGLTDAVRLESEARFFDQAAVHASIELSLKQAIGDRLVRKGLRIAMRHASDTKIIAGCLGTLDRHWVLLATKTKIKFRMLQCGRPGAVAYQLLRNLRASFCADGG